MNENLFKLKQRRRNLPNSPVLIVLVVCETQACASSTPPFLWDTHVCFFKSFFFLTRLQLVPKSSPRLLNCHHFFWKSLQIKHLVIKCQSSTSIGFIRHSLISDYFQQINELWFLLLLRFKSALLYFGQT